MIAFGTDLNELGAVGGGVLALHVEDALREAKGLDSGDGESGELLLLLQGQDAGTVAARLVEVRLQRGPAGQSMTLGSRQGKP